jgi:energy-coupling factor transporter ATP-binding protein EcfA2
MLRGVRIHNYRAIVQLSLGFDSLTALVGPNGAGKSTVLRALNFLLGDRWPSLSQLDIPGDYYGLDASQPLRIEAHFDPALVYADAKGDVHEVSILRFETAPYKKKTGDKLPGDLRDTFVPLNSDGAAISVCIRRPAKGQPPQFQPLISVNSGLREQARVLTIGENRTVFGQLPGRRGSVLRDLLDEARRSFLRDASGERTDFQARYHEAVDALRTDELKAVEATIQDTARRMLGFMGGRAAGSLAVEFGFVDPSNPHSSLRLLCKQDGVLLPADNLGMGEQSALVVGLFEAFRQKGQGLNTVLLEEPEIYLHPQAQRYLRRLLEDLVDTGQTQIVMTTHSPVFADMTRFRSLRLLRKADATVTATRVRDPADIAFLDDELVHARLTQYFDAQSAEVLFARAALLVEGHGDRLAAMEVAAKLGIDLDGEGLSVIECGGKNAIPFYARACRSLGIRIAILHDTDIYEGEDLAAWQEEDTKAAPAANERVIAAAGDDVGIFVVEPTLEYALGIGRSARSKPMQVLERVRAQDADTLPAGLIDAVRRLAELVDDDERS